jgi:ABC-type hemin transport system ATPase subunit
VSGLGRTVLHEGRELAIVEAFDVVVEPGSAHGLTGPLDSGWRSVLRLIAGLDPRSAGRVDLAPGLAVEEFRQEVVLASALAPLLERDLGRVVRDLGRLGATRRRRCGRASARALRDAAGVTASGPAGRAERLRLCLALAASMRPAHVLLEVEPRPDSHDDRRALLDLLRRICASGTGVLVGTRDEVLLAALARSVTILEDGRVLASGPPESVIPAACALARRDGLL